MGSPLVIQYENELNAFQGWLTSLYETFMTLYALHDPQNVPTKIQQMASAQLNLWNQRKSRHASLLKDPSLFKELTKL